MMCERQTDIEFICELGRWGLFESVRGPYCENILGVQLGLLKI